MDNYIHDCFSDAALRFPQQTAIWSEGSSLSYEELARTTDSLSQWLQKRLQGKGHRIALLMPKSTEAIISILAILKSGNTYVPLGDSWSDGRINKICLDGQFSLLITDQKDRAIGSQGCHVLSVGSELWLNALGTSVDPGMTAPSIVKEDTAYILYTSGSTGIPKGVCVSHGAAAFFPSWAKNEFSINETDRVASVSPLTFDLSTFDLFTSFAAGATVYIVPEMLKVFPARLSEFMQTHRITCLYAVPSTLILMAQRGKLQNRDFGQLKNVLFAGEEFPVPLFKAFRELMPAGIDYANLYGPTETNVCTYYRVPEGFDGSVFPIGRALPGTHLFVRNAQNNTQSGQTSGELCVAGPAVMSGYFGINDSDADYWVKNPQGGEHRAYATGDQVSTSGDGEWSYHGRLDKMVKIWGYRVELGEVEACLLELAFIDQAVVIKRSGKSAAGDELVAFILNLKNSDKSASEKANADGCALADDESEIDEIRLAISHCKKNLPPYMVPKEIKQLAEIPTNNTGKVDRLRLENLAAE